jgi:hypothetical protein
MSDSDKLAVAAHLYVLLRRATGRVTDVEWLVRDRPYAREIIQLAMAQPGQPELQRWARKLEAALGLTPAAASSAAPLGGEYAEAGDSALSTFSPPSTLGISTLSPPTGLEDSQLDSRMGGDSRIGEARAPGRQPPPRYVGRLR